MEEGKKFWRPNCRGYTHNLDDAGLYEPGEICHPGSRATDIEVPQELAMRLSQRHVPLDSLRDELIKQGRRL